MTGAERLIPCSQAVQELWDYIDEALSAEEQAKVEKHLAFCRKCCGELEFAKELQGFLGSQVSEELPPDVKERMQGFIEDL